MSRFSKELITAPAILPLTAAEVKVHIGIDASGQEPAPQAVTAALAGAGAGNVDNGAHRYRATFVTADGETEGGDISAAVTVADKGVDGQVSLTAIPLGGAAVTQRKLYRTAAAGSDYLLLATLADNTTTIYTDNIADSALGAAAPAANTTDDPKIIAMITAARERAEIHLGRRLITQTWDFHIDGGFPALIRLSDLSPVQSVTSISYIDTDGVSQTLAASKYTLNEKRTPAVIKPAYGESWPVARGVDNAVTVRAVCGYGSARADVPEGIKAGMKIFIGHLDTVRQEVVFGTIAVAIPRTTEHLWAPYRVEEFA